jgi:membrane protease YdiL (CAAX protease family)
MGAYIRAAQQEQQAAEVDRERVIQSAKTRVKWSKIVFVAVFIFGMVVTIAQIFDPNRSKDPNAPSALMLILISPFASALAAYVFWGLYWGIPAVWRWWRNLRSSASGSGFFVIFDNWIVLLILIMFFFYVPLIVGEFYGIFGGGIYEYMKYKKIAAGEI